MKGLTVYPIVNVFPDGPGNVTNVYEVDGWDIYDWKADRIAEAKHFTDAELAAEMWFAVTEFDHYSGLQDALRDDGHWQSQAKTWADRMYLAERFATLPHALEAPDGRE